MWSNLLSRSWNLKKFLDSIILESSSPADSEGCTFGGCCWFTGPAVAVIAFASTRGWPYPTCGISWFQSSPRQRSWVRETSGNTVARFSSLDRWIPLSWDKGAVLESVSHHLFSFFHPLVCVNWPIGSICEPPNLTCVIVKSMIRVRGGRRLTCDWCLILECRCDERLKAKDDGYNA